MVIPTIIAIISSPMRQPCRCRPSDRQRFGTGALWPLPRPLVQPIAPSSQPTTHSAGQSFVDQLFAAMGDALDCY